MQNLEISTDEELTSWLVEADQDFKAKEEANKAIFKVRPLPWDAQVFNFKRNKYAQAIGVSNI